MAERRAPKWINSFLDMLEKQAGTMVVIHTLYVGQNGKMATNT